MKTLIPALLIVLVLVGPTSAADDPWSDYQFLLGDWRGEGDGGPGKGSGGFSFARDLQGKVLVRKNRTDFPATSGRPAFAHEDLMIVYPGEAGGKARAIYFDSEGHVINYAASFSADKRTLSFVSDPTPSAPRFRLSYTRGEGEVLRIKFEIAAPGKPDEFKTYLEGAARREERPRSKV
jgi:hypothetical protein